MAKVTLLRGDSLRKLSRFDNNSIDALVTDPPAGIGFMGKAWDKNKGGRDKWIQWLAGILSECYRVMKPGAHGLVWALPRTSHWTAMACEHAGFEVRDRVSHLFGTGFPKSMNVGKAIDKKLGTTREVVGQYKSQLPGGSTLAQDDWSKAHRGSDGARGDITVGDSPWEGWGTALKPACEDWWLIRKPLEGPVATNVLTYGTGALNIDGCRIGTEGGGTKCSNRDNAGKCRGHGEEISQSGVTSGGRYPAHLVLSHHDECKAIGTKIERGHKGYPKGPGGKSVHWSPNSKRSEECRTGAWEGIPDSEVDRYKCHPDCPVTKLDTQGDEPSRFFYVAKPSSREKNAAGENDHPTVKGIELMQWLIRLITPSKGVVLDPFAGSGTTGVAALREGKKFIGIEAERKYFKIMKQRIMHELKC